MRLLRTSCSLVRHIDYAKGNTEDCNRAFATTLGFEEVEFVD